MVKPDTNRMEPPLEPITVDLNLPTTAGMMEDWVEEQGEPTIFGPDEYPDM